MGLWFLKKCFSPSSKSQLSLRLTKNQFFKWTTGRGCWLRSSHGQDMETLKNSLTHLRKCFLAFLCCFFSGFFFPKGTSLWACYRWVLQEGTTNNGTKAFRRNDPSSGSLWNRVPPRGRWSFLRKTKESDVSEVSQRAGGVEGLGGLGVFELFYIGLVLATLWWHGRYSGVFFFCVYLFSWTGEVIRSLKNYTYCNHLKTLFSLTSPHQQGMLRGFLAPTPLHLLSRGGCAAKLSNPTGWGSFSPVRCAGKDLQGVDQEF